MQSKYQNDGSRMAEVKESLAKPKKRIEIQREKLNMAKQYSGSTTRISRWKRLAELDKDKTTEISNKK